MDIEKFVNNAVCESINEKGGLQFTLIHQQEAARRLGITPRYLSMLDQYAPPRLPQQRGKETLYHWPQLAIWWAELDRLKETCKRNPRMGDDLIDRRWWANRVASLEHGLEDLPAELAPKLAKLRSAKAIQKALGEEIAKLILWARDDPKED